MVNVDWDRVAQGVAREQEKMIWRPYGLPTVLDLENSAFHDAPISAPWDIPEKLAVSVAITGAFFQKSQNPNQPITPGEIIDSARDVARAGASTVHIHVRDDNGYNVLSPDRFRQVIVARNEVDDVDRAIPGVTDHVEADAEVDALLFTLHADAAEPQLHLRQQRDLLLLPRRLPVTRCVVPMGAKQREPRL